MSKATPINQIQQDHLSQQQQQPQVPLDNVDDVLAEMNQQEYFDQQQQPPPQMMQQQQAPHPQMMMMQPPMMPPPMMGSSSGSLVDRLMSELKEALVVAIVFIVLNFEPVSAMLGNVLSKVSTNVHVLLVVKGLVAGLLFYGGRRLIINNN
jgi:hypothetical protein